LKPAPALRSGPSRRPPGAGRRFVVTDANPLITPPPGAQHPSPCRRALTNPQITLARITLPPRPGQHNGPPTTQAFPATLPSGLGCSKSPRPCLLKIPAANGDPQPWRRSPSRWLLGPKASLFQKPPVYDCPVGQGCSTIGSFHHHGPRRPSRVPRQPDLKRRPPNDQGFAFPAVPIHASSDQPCPP